MSSMSMLDWINMSLDSNKLTKKKFKYIRNNGTLEELEIAIKKMETMGGYDALSDE